MKKLKPLIFILLSLIVILAGCTKADTGTPDKTSATESAKVIFSEWISLQMTFSAADSMYEQMIVADSLAQPVLDGGVILTYLKYVNPSNNQIQVINAGNHLEEVFGVNRIVLYSTADFSGLGFRYILIPGGAGVKTARMAAGSSAIKSYSKEQWQAMSYDEVIAAISEK